MAIQSIISSSNANSNSNSTREPSEYDGMWLNVGIMVKSEDGTEQFVRLPRGIAVGDLEPKRIYANMDPEFAAETKLVNQAIAEIQQAAKSLAEGESLNTDALQVQLYRRNEAVEDTDNSNVVPLGLFASK